MRVNRFLSRFAEQQVALPAAGSEPRRPILPINGRERLTHSVVGRAVRRKETSRCAKQDARDKSHHDSDDRDVADGPLQQRRRRVLVHA
jgi:hypothetical protein